MNDRLLAQFDAVVNCCGLRAGAMNGQLDVKPIKGQLVLVRAPGVDKPWVVEVAQQRGLCPVQAKIPGVTDWLDDVEGLLYILPRPHTDIVVLGGSYEVGVADMEPDSKRSSG